MQKQKPTWRTCRERFLARWRDSLTPKELEDVEAFKHAAVSAKAARRCASKAKREAREQQERAILRALLDGLSSYEVARELGLDNRHVRRVAARLGLRRAPPAHRRSPCAIIPVETRNQIAALAAEIGETQAQTISRLLTYAFEENAFHARRLPPGADRCETAEGRVKNERWPQEREDALRELAKDHSSGQIAAKLGVTRNAVVGKALRLKIQLPGLPKIVGRAAYPPPPPPPTEYHPARGKWVGIDRERFVIRCWKCAVLSKPFSWGKSGSIKVSRIVRSHGWTMAGFSNLAVYSCPACSGVKPKTQQRIGRPPKAAQSAPKPDPVARAAAPTPAPVAKVKPPFAPKPAPAPKPKPQPAALAPAPRPFEAATSSEGVSIVDLGPFHCRWPLGEPSSPGFRYCGKAKVDKRYCAEHAKLSSPK